MTFRRAVMLVLALIAMFDCASGSRQFRGWELLGQRTVSDRLDRDQVFVTGARGDFSTIKLAVDRAAIDFHRVVVHFANGEDQEIQLRNTILPGGESRAIDLRAGDRVIRAVEFWYDANTIRGRQGIVRVFGRR